MSTLSDMNNQRLAVVDSLRGMALLAIVLLHNAEHYNIYITPENLPAWLTTLDQWIMNAMYFLFAGKAFATFSLLFGFSFYIQLRNARARGNNFRGRFAWRMFLLFLFSQLHAVFYSGDILLLYSFVGFFLIFFCEMKDRTVLIIALICLFQPVEWLRLLYGFVDPDLETYGTHFRKYYRLIEPVFENGTFMEVLKANIWHGQLYSNCWQIENGRLLQTLALFLFGMLLGRKHYFVYSEASLRFWKKVMLTGILCFIPLYILR